MTKNIKVTKAEWLRALRSKKYRQTSGVLERHGSFCCLGVLRDLALRKGFETQFNHSDVYLLRGERGEGCRTLPFASAIGLNLRNQIKLGDMNDSGKSFKEIASWIEKNIRKKRP